MNPNDYVILGHILLLYNGKTGDAHIKEEKEDLIREGEKRYKGNIPPGYKVDGKRVSNECDNNAYGDFLYGSKIIKILYLLVDWWYKPRGKDKEKQ